MKISPRDYARTNRRWQGAVPITSFSRLAGEFAESSDSVDVELAFSFDENQRIRMEGHASVRASVSCHRCAESVLVTVQADIDARVVTSERQAQELAQSIDVLIVTESSVPVTELVEDDLILSIPWKVCEAQETCENLSRSLLSESKIVKAESDEHRPFANLQQLIDERQGSK